jgi:CRP/FNR family cyclic AMP-dependent transcriptional regulator
MMKRTNPKLLTARRALMLAVTCAAAGPHSITYPLLRLAMSEIDMRIFAQNAGVNITFAPGSVIFNQDDPGNCMYVVQSGVIEMLIGDKVVEVCSANEAIGFMSVIDQSPRSATARAKESVQLSVIDQRTFKFMVDEVPNFAMYVMSAMARRIRGMSRAI